MKAIELTGRRFGRLVVMGRGERLVSPSGQGQLTWACRCDCGQQVSVRGRSLRKGQTLSCGCLRRELTSTRRDVEVEGRRFGRLIAIRRHGWTGESVTWECRCDCGATTVVRSTSLRRGLTQSCGCLNVERTREANSRDVVTYTGAHARVLKLRGPARNYACVDCGKRAIDWSYDGQDPEELIWESRWRLRYSQSPDHYKPRCRRCHNHYDRALREERVS